MAPKPISTGSKKTKSRLSTLTLESFPSSSGHVSSNSTSLPADFQMKKPIRPLTSISNPPMLQLSGKGKGKMTSLPLPNDITEVDEDDQLWVDKYVPQTEEELAVHKKKVEDVRRWLSEALDGGPTGVLKKYRRLLSLTGPAGTGKTATLRVLAREMNFEILEWRNSLEDNFSGDDMDYDRESLVKKFQTFLTRASSCRALPFLSPELPSSSSTQIFTRQIILLEDLPNILDAGTAEAFHAALQEYLDSSPGVPLICIISDAGTRGEDPDNEMSGGRAWGKWSKQALDVRSVIPPDILNSPYFREIQFNPIAPTLMTKALNTLLTKHFSTVSKSKGSALASKNFIETIIESSHGDIRSAIMALQFACIVQLPKNAKKGSANALLEAITRREQSLALFQLLGKVFYNKRKGDPPNPSASTKDRERERELDARISHPTPLPPYLSAHERKASRVDVNMLYADSPVDTSLFSLYLHHNYTQFCEDIDECNGVCDWLSWIDSSGSQSWQIQQNPHQFHILTHGVLHSLPSPVQRRSQKLYKPDFFEVLKKMREAEANAADTEEWLNQAIISQNEDGRRWTREEIVLELGGVLKALDACGQNTPPRSHRTFSTLPFVHPSKMTHSSQKIQELEENEEPMGDFPIADDFIRSRVFYDAPQKKAMDSWLETDDIQDF